MRERSPLQLGSESTRQDGERGRGDSLGQPANDIGCGQIGQRVIQNAQAEGTGREAIEDLRPAVSTTVTPKVRNADDRR